MEVTTGGENLNTGLDNYPGLPLTQSWRRCGAESCDSSKRSHLLRKCRLRITSLDISRKLYLTLKLCKMFLVFALFALCRLQSSQQHTTTTKQAAAVLKPACARAGNTKRISAVMYEPRKAISNL